jgi:hypothetical protein
MSSHVRPGGRIAISLWAEGFISEHRALFLEDIGSVRSEAAKGLRGGTSVKNPEEMAGFLQSSGLVEPVCEHVPYIHSLDGPQAWWNFLMNSGMRGQIEMLTSAELSEFRPMHLENMRQLQTSEGKFLLNMPATLGMGMVTG